MSILGEPLELPCGVVLQNRLAKASMTEGLADAHDNPTPELSRLYETWSRGGAGMHLTGNVQVDRRYLERAGNVVLDDDTDLDALATWATAGTSSGNHLFMQISHPGRQCQKLVNARPVAPSEVGLNLAGLFGKPRALEVDEIHRIIAAFGVAASRAKDAGFTGVQIHGAHGYLVSQFLSPRVNQRTDEWGGSLQNRARFLLSIVDTVRAAVGASFPVVVKLNSADFSKGGFSNEDSAQVATWLGEKGIDLLEISGGTYESVAFIKRVDGPRKSEATRAREAYFLEYASVIRKACDVPLMLTGGFRTVAAMEEAVTSGDVDVVGIARPFCVVPDFPRAVLSGELEALPAPEDDLRLGGGILGPSSSNATLRAFNSQAQTAWFYRQILHLSEGEPADLSLGTRTALLQHLSRDTRKNFARKKRG